MKKEIPVESRIKALLDEPFWPKTLKTEESYFRTHDDCDGDLGQGVSVTIDPQGDVWLNTTTPKMTSCRFRTFFGGGQSLRVRNALLLLAEAIRLDNEERPQRK